MTLSKSVWKCAGFSLSSSVNRRESLSSFEHRPCEGKVLCPSVSFFTSPLFIYDKQFSDYDLTQMKYMPLTRSCLGGLSYYLSNTFHRKRVSNFPPLLGNPRKGKLISAFCFLLSFCIICHRQFTCGYFCLFPEENVDFKNVVILQLSESGKNVRNTLDEKTIATGKLR